MRAPATPMAGAPPPPVATVVRVPRVSLGTPSPQLSSSVRSVGGSHTGTPLSSRPYSTASTAPQVQVLTSARTGRPSLSSSVSTVSSVKVAAPVSPAIAPVMRFSGGKQAASGLARPASNRSLTVQTLVKPSPSATQVASPLIVARPEQAASPLTIVRPVQAPRPANLYQSGSVVAERQVSEDHLVVSGNLVRNEALEAELRRKAGLVPGAIPTYVSPGSLNARLVEPPGPLFVEQASAEVAPEELTGCTASPVAKGGLPPEAFLPPKAGGGSAETEAPPEDRSPQTEPPEVAVAMVAEAGTALQPEYVAGFDLAATEPALRPEHDVGAFVGEPAFQDREPYITTSVMDPIMQDPMPERESHFTTPVSEPVMQETVFGNETTATFSAEVVEESAPEVMTFATVAAPEPMQESSPGPLTLAAVAEPESAPVIVTERFAIPEPVEESAPVLAASATLSAPEPVEESAPAFVTSATLAAPEPEEPAAPAPSRLGGIASRLLRAGFKIK